MITGCVSVQSLEQDINSNDATRNASAAEKMSQVVTKGRVGLVSFNEKDRLWCARNLKDKKLILSAIEAMSHVHSDNHASIDEQRILEGMRNDVNAPVLEALLVNLGMNEDAFAIFVKRDIHYAQNTRAIASKYVEAYVNSIEDKNVLCRLLEIYSHWLEMGLIYNYEMPMRLYEDIIPARFVTLISGLHDVKAFLESYKSRGQSFPKQAESAISKITSQQELAVLLADYKDYFDEIVMKRITDSDILVGIALNEKGVYGSSAEKLALEKITDKATLVRIALLARSERISYLAKEKVGDTSAFVEGLTSLIKDGKLDDDSVIKHVQALDDSSATTALYEVVQGRALKQLVFRKLSGENRKAVRAGDSEKCKKLIEEAKDKANGTFELGGFYLGMNIADAEALIGYYFPDWATTEAFDGDDETTRVIRVPQQRCVFCRANKDGKIWQLNFGKKILKKWYSYDVQDFREWARAYSRENKIDMKYKEIEKEATVTEPMDWSRSYKVWFHQESYQYKHNTKEYRLTYFGEEKDFTFEGGIGGAIIKEMAAPRFRYVRGDPGSLRVAIEHD